MANLSPLTSQSPSKENDSIDDGSAQRRAAKSEDDFEDSLNVSISEQISEEIESHNNSSAIEDSIEKPAQRFDQLMSEKKRKLFDFDDSDRSEAVDNDGIRMFSKFDPNHLDESLAGDNIAKHFVVEPETSTHRGSVNEPVASSSIAQQHRTESDAKLKIADANEGAVHPSTTNVSTTSKPIDEMQQSKDSSHLDELQHQSDSHKSVSGDGDKSDEKHDVILINDHEISIHSLKELQRQISRSDIANQTNQNTISDISDLQNEDNAKDQRSIDDLSINETSDKVESHSAEGEVERSKSSSDKVSNSKSEDQSDEQQEESTNSDEKIKKCQPMDEDSLPALSVIEEVSATEEEQLGHHNLAESNSEKRTEMQKILEEAVYKLPLDKENRPPIDDLLSIGSKQLTSSQNSTTTDGTVYTAFARTSDVNVIPANFEDELNLNLLHMQNKIKELHNINSGKYSASFFDYPLVSSSRRDSLRDSLKDFPQSGRDSTSITTNSTEYRPFQDEYNRVSKQKHQIASQFEFKPQKSIF